MQRFWTETDFEGALVELCDGETDAIDRDGVPNVAVMQDAGCLDGDAKAIATRFGCVMRDDGVDDADMLYEASEHWGNAARRLEEMSRR